jgi:multiple sugar transport system permease protein
MTAITANPLRFINKLLVYIILISGALVLIFPLIWTVSTSLKVPEKVSLTAIALIPDPVAWWNYPDLFKKFAIPTYFFNTLKILLPALFGGFVTCSLAGYAFARIRFPGRDVLFMMVLSTMMLPYVVRIIPLYIMFDQIKMINTFWPLIIPRLLGHDAFFIFLYRQFFRGLPEDLFDAGRVDGLSEFGIWGKIVLPLSKPVLVTVAIFSFQNAWNDFLFPLIYLGAKKDNWTMALGLYNMRSIEGQLLWNQLMAYSVLMIIPVLLVFAWGQRHIVEGSTMTGIKG